MINMNFPESAPEECASRAGLEAKGHLLGLNWYCRAPRRLRTRRSGPEADLPKGTVLWGGWGRSPANSMATTRSGSPNEWPAANRSAGLSGWRNPALGLASTDRYGIVADPAMQPRFEHRPMRQAYGAPQWAQPRGVWLAPGRHRGGCVYGGGLVAEL